jgi:hypothetical protein
MFQILVFTHNLEKNVTPPIELNFFTLKTNIEITGVLKIC